MELSTLVNGKTVRPMALDDSHILTVMSIQECGLTTMQTSGAYSQEKKTKHIIKRQ